MTKLPFFILLLFSICGMGQNVTLPQFPGGESELYKYIKLQTPEQNETAHASVFFYIGADGSVLRPVIATSSQVSSTDSIALDIAKRMPRWIPGTINNTPKEMAACIYIDFGNKRQVEEELIPVSITDLNIEDIELSIAEEDFMEIPDKKPQPVKKEKTVFSENEDSKIMIVVSDDDDDNGVDIAELKEYKVIVEEEKPEGKPFVSVEQMPSFPGGDAELQKFIEQNLKYPVVAQENGIQGRVTIRFVVEVDGTLSNFTVLRGIDPQCDKEAVRMMEAGPKWIPGKQNGREVRVYFTLPVIFKIDNNE